jgi:hypothetical protein
MYRSIPADDARARDVISETPLDDLASRHWILERLIRNLPGIVSNQCRGIWVHVDAGSWSPPSIAQWPAY